MNELDLQIKRSDGLKDFEQYLSKPSTFQKTIVLPNDLDEGGGVGASVALSQFLLTWARKSENREIRTYIKDGDQAAMEAFTERGHGLCAAYFSKRLFAINDDGTRGPDIRSQVLRAAKSRFEAMSRGDLERLGRGREIEFLFVQNTKNQFHGSLYSKIPSPAELLDRQKHGELIRSHRELNRLLELCFTQLNITQYITKFIQRTDYIFGALLSEVFRNTAEHAFLTLDGKRLELNIRSIRLATTLITRDKLAQKTIGSPRAANEAREYFARLAELRSEFRHEMVRVLELSVFDSGPGFAATIEGRNLIDDSEICSAVARCFCKHQSAKAASGAGEGLFKVLGLLRDLGGFFRVRTSTIEAFHGASPDDTSEADPANFVYGGLAEVQGSVVTICIPISY